MTHQKVTDRQAVLDAINECDRLGKAAFLEEYGYGEARAYILVEAGSHYDSKAIYGVAHKFQHGRPLAYDDFSGGIRQVVTPLRDLGFAKYSPKMISLRRTLRQPSWPLQEVQTRSSCCGIPRTGPGATKQGQ